MMSCTQVFKRSAMLAALVALCALWGTPALADATGSAWTVKGFGTLGTSGTDTDRIGFRRDITQGNGVTRSWGIDTDSRLGVQVDVDIAPDWHATAQWVARNHAGDFLEQNLELAFLRWRPRPDLDVRIGRMGFDVFMLSDYRNVGYAYTWIRPPHEFYGSLAPYHFDGVDIAKRFAVDGGYLTVKAQGGHAFYQVPFGTTQTLDGRVGLGGASVVYERGNWRARLGYTYSQTLNTLPVGTLLSTLRDPTINAVWPNARSLTKEFSVRGQEVHYATLGAAYDDGLWLAQMEAAYIDTEISGFPSQANGYLSLGRRFDKVTLYTLFGIAKTLQKRVKIPDPLFPLPQVTALRNSVDGAINGNGVDERSISLGARWDVHTNVALKAQWSHYWLGQNGTQLWIEPASGRGTPANVNVISLGLDFVF